MINKFGKEEADKKWKNIYSQYAVHYNKYFRDYLIEKVPIKYRFAVVNLIIKNIMNKSADVEGIFQVEYINDPFEEEF